METFWKKTISTVSVKPRIWETMASSRAGEWLLPASTFHVKTVNLGSRALPNSDILWRKQFEFTGSHCCVEATNCAIADIEASW